MVVSDAIEMNDSIVKYLIEEQAMIHWPAILHMHQQAELIYLADQAQSQSYIESQRFIAHAQDRLIDSAGQLYSLSAANGWNATAQQLSLAELLNLIREHAAALDICCVAKLAAPTIPQALALVASLQNDEI
jgi:protein structure with unknown function